MENPRTWKKTEKVVAEAIAKYRKQLLNKIVGLSEVRTITDALRREGLLNEDEKTETEKNIDVWIKRE